MKSSMKIKPAGSFSASDGRTKIKKSLTGIKASNEQYEEDDEDLIVNEEDDWNEDGVPGEGFNRSESVVVSQDEVIARLKLLEGVMASKGQADGAASEGKNRKRFKREQSNVSTMSATSTGSVCSLSSSEAGGGGLPREQSWGGKDHVFASHEFWVELRARVNGRSLEEEEEEIRRMRREGRTVMLRVKRFEEILEMPKGTSGCTLDVALQYLKQEIRASKIEAKSTLASKHESKHSVRAHLKTLKEKDIASLDLRQGGLTGYIPKDIVKKLVLVGNAASKNNLLDKFFDFLEAARHRIPVCKWNRMVHSWNTYMARQFADLGMILDELRIESEIRQLVDELDELEQSFPLVHSKYSNLIGSRFGEVTTSSLGRSNPEAAVHILPEYKLLDDSYVQLTGKTDIDPAFAENYVALHVWLRSKETLNTCINVMQADLKEARANWKDSPDLNGLLRNVLISDYTGFLLQLPRKALYHAQILTRTPVSHRSLHGAIQGDESRVLSSFFDRLYLPALHPSAVQLKRYWRERERKKLEKKKKKSLSSAASRSDGARSEGASATLSRQTSLHSISSPIGSETTAVSSEGMSHFGTNVMRRQSSDASSSSDISGHDEQYATTKSFEKSSDKSSDSDSGSLVSGEFGWSPGSGGKGSGGTPCSSMSGGHESGGSTSHSGVGSHWSQLLWGQEETAEKKEEGKTKKGRESKRAAARKGSSGKSAGGEEGEGRFAPKPVTPAQVLAQLPLQLLLEVVRSRDAVAEGLKRDGVEVSVEAARLRLAASVHLFREYRKFTEELREHIDHDSCEEGAIGWEGESEMRRLLLQLLDHVISLVGVIYTLPSSSMYGPKELQETCRAFKDDIKDVKDAASVVRDTCSQSRIGVLQCSITTTIIQKACAFLTAPPTWYESLTTTSSPTNLGSPTQTRSPIGVNFTADNSRRWDINTASGPTKSIMPGLIEPPTMGGVPSVASSMASSRPGSPERMVERDMAERDTSGCVVARVAHRLASACCGDLAVGMQVLFKDERRLVDMLIACKYLWVRDALFSREGHGSGAEFVSNKFVYVFCSSDLKEDVGTAWEHFQTVSYTLNDNDATFDSGRGHLVIVSLTVESKSWRFEKDAPKGTFADFWTGTGGKAVECNSRSGHFHPGPGSAHETTRHLWVCVRSSRALKQELVKFKENMRGKGDRGKATHVNKETPVVTDESDLFCGCSEGITKALFHLQDELEGLYHIALTAADRILCSRDDSFLKDGLRVFGESNRCARVVIADSLRRLESWSKGGMRRLVRLIGLAMQCRLTLPFNVGTMPWGFLFAWGAALCEIHNLGKQGVIRRALVEGLPKFEKRLKKLAEFGLPDHLFDEAITLLSDLHSLRRSAPIRSSDTHSTISPLGHKLKNVGARTSSLALYTSSRRSATDSFGSGSTGGSGEVGSSPNSLGNSFGPGLSRRGFGCKLGRVLTDKDVESPELLRDPDTKAVLGWIRGRPLAGGGKEQTGRVRTLVYQAHLCEYMQTIIVKEIHIIDYSRYERAKQRCCDEIKEVMKITANHPNIIYYWGTSCPSETQVNIFCEYCPEGSLYKYLRTLKNAEKSPGLQTEMREGIASPTLYGQSVVPLPRVQAYSRQLVAAMSCIHAGGGYHGRLRSKSIMIADNGNTIKVTDFGEVFLRHGRRAGGGGGAAAGMSGTGWGLTTGMTVQRNMQAGMGMGGTMGGTVLNAGTVLMSSHDGQLGDVWSIGHVTAEMIRGDQAAATTLTEQTGGAGASSNPDSNSLKEGDAWSTAVSFVRLACSAYGDEVDDAVGKVTTDTLSEHVFLASDKP